MQQYLETHTIKKPTLQQIRKGIIEVRASKGMVLLPEYEAYKTAGSFFAHPIVDSETHAKVKELVYEENYEKAKRLEPWYFSASYEKVKIVSGFLMEFTPYNKTDFAGKTFNETVALSPKHTLSLINVANAKAQDMFDFAKEIQDTVYKKFGIQLEPEVRFVGNFTDTKHNSQNI